MNHLNSVLIEGVVLHNPELKTTNSGARLAVFTIASHRFIRVKDSNAWHDDAIFLDILTFGDLADRTLAMITKGTTARIMGRLRISTYTSRDGIERTNVSIVAQNLEFRRKRPTENGNLEEEEVMLNGDASEDMPEVGEKLVIYEY